MLFKMNMIPLSRRKCLLYMCTGTRCHTHIHTHTQRERERERERETNTYTHVCTSHTDTHKGRGGWGGGGEGERTGGRDAHIFSLCLIYEKNHSHIIILKCIWIMKQPSLFLVLHPCLVSHQARTDPSFFSSKTNNARSQQQQHGL